MTNCFFISLSPSTFLHTQYFELWALFRCKFQTFPYEEAPFFLFRAGNLDIQKGGKYCSGAPRIACNKWQVSWALCLWKKLLLSPHKVSTNIGLIPNDVSTCGHIKIIKKKKKNKKPSTHNLFSVSILLALSYQS